MCILNETETPGNWPLDKDHVASGDISHRLTIYGINHSASQRTGNTPVSSADNTLSLPSFSDLARHGRENSPQQSRRHSPDAITSGRASNIQNEDDYDFAVVLRANDEYRDVLESQMIVALRGNAHKAITIRDDDQNVAWEASPHLAKFNQSDTAGDRHETPARTNEPKHDGLCQCTHEATLTIAHLKYSQPSRHWRI